MIQVTVNWGGRLYQAPSHLGIVRKMRDDSSFTRGLRDQEYLDFVKSNVRLFFRLPLRLRGAGGEAKARALLEDLAKAGFCTIIQDTYAPLDPGAIAENTKTRGEV